jgi:hypothetical protein
MSAFEADRFNRSRTSPRKACGPVLVVCLKSDKCYSLIARKPAVANQHEPMTPSDQRLTTASEELLQHLRAMACQDSGLNLDAVVQPGMIQNLHHGMNCSGFGIVGSVNETTYAGVNQGASAHRARFNCSKQFAVAQAMVAYGCTSLAQRDDLGVARGIGVEQVAVPAASHDTAIAHHHSSDRHFARLESSLGSAQSLPHPEFVSGRQLSAIGRLATRGWLPLVLRHLGLAP